MTSTFPTAKNWTHIFTCRCEHFILLKLLPLTHNCPPPPSRRSEHLSACLWVGQERFVVDCWPFWFEYLEPLLIWRHLGTHIKVLAIQPFPIILQALLTNIAYRLIPMTDMYQENICTNLLWQKSAPLRRIWRLFLFARNSHTLQSDALDKHQSGRWGNPHPPNWNFFFI